jgi:hypothetical protein
MSAVKGHHWLDEGPEFNMLEEEELRPFSGYSMGGGCVGTLSEHFSD